MKLVVTVEDHKAVFFLELLENLEDFVTVEALDELPGEGAISEEHKAILEERLEAYRRNPESVVAWSAAYEKLRQRKQA